MAHAMREVADLLGNTPAVARAAYVDPRVVEAYEAGETAGGEAGVRELLRPGPRRGAGRSAARARAR